MRGSVARESAKHKSLQTGFEIRHQAEVHPITAEWQGVSV